MNLEKITSGDELVSLFPDKFNSNMDEIDAAVGDNTSDISALDTRMTKAEGDIDAAQEDISAIKLSLTHITDNGWSVIKYSDGTFEATASLNLNYEAGTAWGSSGFYFHKSQNISIPSSAVSIGLFFASPYGSQLCWVVGTTVISASGFAVYVMDATSVATSGHPLAARMVGRWK